MKKCIVTLLLPLALGATLVPAIAQSQGTAPVPATPTTDRATIARQFVDLLAAGDFQAAQQLYSSSVRETVSPDSIATNWQDIQQLTGTFQRSVGARLQQIQGSGGTSSVAIVTAAFAESGSGDLIIQFTSDGIVSFDYAGASSAAGFNTGGAATTPGFGQQ